MTDRELLEMAAKAAGVFMKREDWPYSDPFDPKHLETTFDPDDCSITGTVVWYGIEGELGGTERLKWCPLTDDGDALRLAVACRMQIDILERSVYALAMSGTKVCELDRADPYAATRRAIVRAAAEIGKGMP